MGAPENAVDRETEDRGGQEAHKNEADDVDVAEQLAQIEAELAALEASNVRLGQMREEDAAALGVVFSKHQLPPIAEGNSDEESGSPSSAEVPWQLRTRAVTTIREPGELGTDLEVKTNFQALPATEVMTAAADPLFAGDTAVADPLLAGVDTLLLAGEHADGEASRGDPLFASGKQAHSGFGCSRPSWEDLEAPVGNRPAQPIRTSEEEALPSNASVASDNFPLESLPHYSPKLPNLYSVYSAMPELHSDDLPAIVIGTPCGLALPPLPEPLATIREEAALSVEALHLHVATPCPDPTGTARAGSPAICIGTPAAPTIYIGTRCSFKQFPKDERGSSLLLDACQEAREFGWTGESCAVPDLSFDQGGLQAPVEDDTSCRNSIAACSNPIAVCVAVGKRIQPRSGATPSYVTSDEQTVSNPGLACPTEIKPTAFKTMPARPDFLVPPGADTQTPNPVAAGCGSHRLPYGICVGERPPSPESAARHPAPASFAVPIPALQVHIGVDRCRREPKKRPHEIITDIVEPESETAAELEQPEDPCFWAAPTPRQGSTPIPAFTPDHRNRYRDFEMVRQRPAQIITSPSLAATPTSSSGKVCDSQAPARLPTPPQPPGSAEEQQREKERQVLKKRRKNGKAQDDKSREEAVAEEDHIKRQERLEKLGLGAAAAAVRPVGPLAPPAAPLAPPPLPAPLPAAPGSAMRRAPSVPARLGTSHATVGGGEWAGALPLPPALRRLQAPIGASGTEVLRSTFSKGISLPSLPGRTAETHPAATDSPVASVHGGSSASGGDRDTPAMPRRGARSGSSSLPALHQKSRLPPKGPETSCYEMEALNSFDACEGQMSAVQLQGLLSKLQTTNGVGGRGCGVGVPRRKLLPATLLR